MAEEATARLQNCFNAKTEEESVQYYNVWAENYENDIIKEHKWRAPQILVEFVVENVAQRDIEVLDIGAGTGLAGELLKNVGFEKIDAHDGSCKMLEIAKARGVYRHYFEEIFHEKTESQIIPAKSYDLVVSVGTFLPGHLNENHLEAFIGPVKSGGKLIFGMNEHSETESFVNRLNQFEETKKLEKISRKLIDNYRFELATQQMHKGVYYAFKVC